MPDTYYDDPAFYDATVRGVEGDIEFYRDLAVASGGPVVEVGIGTGRIAIPTLQAGVEVIGVDRSPAMLEVAARRAAEAGVEARLTLLEGDMRTFDAPRRVPLVTIPFRTFLHNLTVEDQRATLASAYRALEPGGRLVLNAFNPDLAIIASWRGAPRSATVPFDASGRVEAHHDFAAETPVVTSRLRWRTGMRVRSAEFTLRYVTREEMQGLLEEAGFEVEALYGDFARAPFGETATEMVWVACRAL